MVQIVPFVPYQQLALLVMKVYTMLVMVPVYLFTIIALLCYLMQPVVKVVTLATMFRMDFVLVVQEIVLNVLIMKLVQLVKV